MRGRNGLTRAGTVLVAVAALLALLAPGMATAGSRAPAQACHTPRVQDVDVPVPEGVTVPDNTVRIILPACYHAHAPTRYPVVYVLHGVGDTFATWSENTDIVEFTEDLEVIVVMPDGGHGNAAPNEAGWYSDWLDQSRQWETFHTQVLVDWVDDNLRTLGDGHRAVMGLSMGGFGAMSYAARHPDLYQAAASFSGAVDTMYGWPVNGFAFEQLHDQFGTPDDRVWGDHIENEDEWRAHNPTDRAADLAGTDLYITTGTGTPGGFAGDDLPGNPGGYGIEAFIFQLNLSFIAHLELAGVDHTDWIYPGGYHGWPYWEAALHWALPQILDTI